MPSRELVALEQIGPCCATGETATQLVQPAAQGCDSQCGFWRACLQQVQLEDRLLGSKDSRCAVSSRRKGQGTGGLSRKGGWATGRFKPLGQTSLGLRPRAATYCTCCVILRKSFNLSELQFPRLLNEDLNLHL